MIDFLDMDSNKLVISEFYENDTAGKYDYNTVYQRDKVWSEEKKSFLIDSILKNYPIPPIFLRMKIDPETGLTKYEVIDGKQRLTTIIDFIEGRVCLPDDFGDDKIGNSLINGASFADLSKPENDKYKKQFWRYRIPVIFIETEDNELVKNVFDRLNRNGEPLVPQELRHAQYGETKFYEQITQLLQNHKWKKIFNTVLETERMEDAEFVSEMLFVLLEKKISSYTKETLDELYKKWRTGANDEIVKAFENYMSYIDSMNLDYEVLKITKVSHLYAIWVLGILGKQQNIDAGILKDSLNKFYNLYIEKSDGVGIEEYKKSMSSNTKGSASRRRRVQAILDYLKSNGVILKFKIE